MFVNTPFIEYSFVHAALHEISMCAIRSKYLTQASDHIIAS